MDYDLERGSRHCAITGRELAPGEEFFSALVPAVGGLVRVDYARDAWQGPPEAAWGWWKSRLPRPDEKPRPARLHAAAGARLPAAPDSRSADRGP